MGAIAEIGRFFDPVSILIVFGGAALMAALRSTRSDLAGALAACRPLLRADPAAESDEARAVVARIGRIAEMRTIACADRVKAVCLFLRRAAIRLAEAEDTEAFARWAEDEIEATGQRHARIAAVWRAVADAAPQMGMLGTIVGLVGMFATMDDAARIGPAMALAMLTTFHGILLAACVAGPIAARLERLSEEELAWKRWACRRLAAIAAAELDVAPELATPAQVRRLRDAA